MAKRYDIKQVTRYVLIGGELNDTAGFHDIAEFKRRDEAEAVKGSLNADEFRQECDAKAAADAAADFLIAKLKDSVNGFLVTTGHAQYDAPLASHAALIFDKVDSSGFVSKSSCPSEDVEQADGAIFDFILRLKDYLADRPGMIVWRKRPKLWGFDRSDGTEFSVYAELAVVPA